MLCIMQLRRTLLACIAISFAAIDLVHKSIATAEFHHARTPLVALMMFALIAALVVFVPRVPSNAAAIGAGVACGGALGNLVSLFAWAQGVPDPLIVTSGVHASRSISPTCSRSQATRCCSARSPVRDPSPRPGSREPV